MTVRPPAVAGRFYPADARELRTQITALLASVPAEHSATPKVLVVPHAGYDFSGPVAAQAFAHVRNQTTIQRVVLLGPTHRQACTGIALSPASAWASPLGLTPIDASLRRLALEQDAVQANAAVHAEEHSLEVQLPFLQELLPVAAILPLLCGRVAIDAVAALIDILWQGPETLLLISTDLSHFLPASAAQTRDLATLDHIARGAWRALDGTRACGFTGLAGLLACRHAPRLTRIAYQHSGDTTRSYERVVGYASLVA